MTASDDAPVPDPSGAGREGRVRRQLLVASTCLVAAGVLAFAQGALVFIAGTEMGSAYMDELGCCSLVSVLFGAVALLAGYGVHVRSGFRFLVVSCVIAVFSVGFFAGSALAFVALYLVGRNRDEFR